MKIKKIIIDTNVFEHAYVVPKEKEYIDIHKRANEFVLRILADKCYRILISSYQVVEVLEILRKVGATAEIRDNFFSSTKTEKFIKREITYELVDEIYPKSKGSGIHLYDYLVVYPFKDEVEVIYSADEHMFHEDFTSSGMDYRRR